MSCILCCVDTQGQLKRARSQVMDTGRRLLERAALPHRTELAEALFARLGFDDARGPRSAGSA